MSVNRGRSEPEFRRLALAPGLLGTVLVIAATLLIDNEAYSVFRYLVSILALICLWFAVQGRAWWALPLLAAVAVLWNPVFPIPVPEPWWMAAHYVAALVFIVVGVLVKVRTEEPSRGR